MIVHKLTCQHREHGVCIAWFPSKREARKRATEWKKDEDRWAVEVEPPVNIPTDKKGLLDWLNIHMTLDNG
jgi:hypothetical protein